MSDPHATSLTPCRALAARAWRSPAAVLVVATRRGRLRLRGIGRLDLRAGVPGAAPAASGAPSAAASTARQPAAASRHGVAVRSGRLRVACATASTASYTVVVEGAVP